MNRDGRAPHLELSPPPGMPLSDLSSRNISLEHHWTGDQTGFSEHGLPPAGSTPPWG